MKSIWNSFGARPYRTLRRRILNNEPNLPVVAHHPHSRQRIIATPPWADFDRIRAVYIEAERLTKVTGIKHHVDHEIPLHHPRVSGLHVHNNLKPVPAGPNMSKSNRWCPEQIDMFDDHEQLQLFLER